MTLNLPLILGLEAEVTDAFGEVVNAKADVKVLQAAATNWTDVVQNIQDIADAQTKLQYA